MIPIFALCRTFLHNVINVWTLNCLTSFLNVSFSESFTRKQEYGLTVLVSTDEKVNQFLDSVLSQIESWLIKRKIRKLVTVFLCWHPGSAKLVTVHYYNWDSELSLVCELVASSNLMRSNRLLVLDCLKSDSNRLLIEFTIPFQRLDLLVATIRFKSGPFISKIVRFRSKIGWIWSKLTFNWLLSSFNRLLRSFNRLLQSFNRSFRSF